MITCYLVGYSVFLKADTTLNSSLSTALIQVQLRSRQPIKDYGMKCLKRSIFEILSFKDFSSQYFTTKILKQKSSKNCSGSIHIGITSVCKLSINFQMSFSVTEQNWRSKEPSYN